MPPRAAWSPRTRRRFTDSRTRRAPRRRAGDRGRPPGADARHECPRRPGRGNPQAGGAMRDHVEGSVIMAIALASRRPRRVGSRVWPGSHAPRIRSSVRGSACTWPPHAATCSPPSEPVRGELRRSGAQPRERQGRPRDGSRGARPHAQQGLEAAAAREVGGARRRREAAGREARSIREHAAGRSPPPPAEDCQ